MRHDMESCDQGGEDQDKTWLEGPVTSVKGKLSDDQRLVFSRWNSTVGRGTAVSDALAENSSFASTALFGLGAINRGGARAWAGC